MYICLSLYISIIHIYIYYIYTHTNTHIHTHTHIYIYIYTYLVAARPSLGHWQKGSLIHPMFIKALLLVQPKSYLKPRN